MEKPFGKDSESFRQLSADLYQHLTEDQMYRIDHYLGKELIENLTVRFSSSDPSHPPFPPWLLVMQHASIHALPSCLV